MDLRPRSRARAPRARPRASFAVREQGGGLRALHLAPCPIAVVADGLDDEGVEVVFGAGRIRMPPALAAALSGSISLTSAPVRGSGHAVPPGADAFAAVVRDEASGTVHARDHRILHAVLRRWLGEHLALEGVAFGLAGVDDAAIARLAEPLPSAWLREPQLRRTSGPGSARPAGPERCTLEFRTSAARADGVDPVEPPVRWIGGGGTGWRTDWTW